MTNQEIKVIKQRLKDINHLPFEKRGKPLQEIAIDIGANLPISAPSAQIHLFEKIHTVLQTEMMLNACVSAKQSCFLAAIATIAGCISIIVTLLSG